MIIYQVAPHAGAWIETLIFDILGLRYFVAPLSISRIERSSGSGYPISPKTPQVHPLPIPQRRCGIDFLQIVDDRLPILERHELQGIVDHVDNTQLHFNLREHRGNGVWKS